MPPVPAASGPAPRRGAPPRRRRAGPAVTPMHAPAPPAVASHSPASTSPPPCAPPRGRGRPPRVRRQRRSAPSPRRLPGPASPPRPPGQGASADRRRPAPSSGARASPPPACGRAGADGLALRGGLGGVHLRRRGGRGQPLPHAVPRHEASRGQRRLAARLVHGDRVRIGRLRPRARRGGTRARRGEVGRSQRGPQRVLPRRAHFEKRAGRGRWSWRLEYHERQPKREARSLEAVAASMPAIIYRQPADAADVAAGSDDDDDYDPDPAGRPAFAVAGEPTADPRVPPSDGLEYLRRVRTEASALPAVTTRRGDLLHAAASFAGLPRAAAAGRRRRRARGRRPRLRRAADLSGCGGSCARAATRACRRRRCGCPMPPTPTPGRFSASARARATTTRRRRHGRIVGGPAAAAEHAAVDQRTRRRCCRCSSAGRARESGGPTAEHGRGSFDGAARAFRRRGRHPARSSARAVRRADPSPAPRSTRAAARRAPMRCARGDAQRPRRDRRRLLRPGPTPRAARRGAARRRRGRPEDDGDSSLTTRTRSSAEKCLSNFYRKFPHAMRAPTTCEC